MQNIQDFEKILNSELNTKIKGSLIKHNQIYLKIDEVDLTEVILFLKTNSKIFYNIVNDNTMIVYDLHSKFQKSIFSAYLSSLKNDDKFKSITHIIFIFKIKITSQNEKNMKDLLQQESKDYDDNSKKNYMFNNMPSYEVFHIKNVLFNITRHSYVPKHEKIKSKEEQDAICKKYNLKKNQFPIILKTDPVSKYFYFQQGDLIKITRPSPSVGEVITYRLCV